MSTAEQESSGTSELRAFLTEPDRGTGAGAGYDGAPLAEHAFFFDPEARGDRSRFVAVGGVRLNRALPYRLRIEDLEPMARRRAGVDSFRLELVKFAFTVLELPRGSTYETVRIRILLDPPHPLMQLRPRNDTTEARRTSSFSRELQPLLSKLMQLDLKFTSTSSVDLTESRPVVTALDLGAEGFGWTYQAQNGSPMSPGVRQTIAVLELPKDADVITGTFDSEAVVTRRLLGLVDQRSTVPVQPPASFHIGL
ncbi:MAG TPA: hypothetical protein VHZ03_12770 [Trebonia sp.]|nr:hypothetical protein [Trebonia sp.]